MKKVLSNKYVQLSTILIAGIFLGKILFHSSTVIEAKHDHSAETEKVAIWTCAMHPQIRMSEPGKCPICGMDLIPLNQKSNTNLDSGAIHFTKEAAALANVATSVVSRQNPAKELRLYGKVQADERTFQNQVAHISGRVEKLMANFTGEPVSKGQVLALIYSPELIVAQQELIEAAKSKSEQPGIYDAAREKVHQWKLTDDQIFSIENTGIIQSDIEVVSNTSGIVTSKRVNTGDYVSQGSVLFEVSDLSRVWIMFDAYESDLFFLKKGDRVDFSVGALPGEKFSGKVSFIDPVMDPVNRVARVRVEMSNPGNKLRPEMFATGIINSSLDDFRDAIVVPRSAVLWTGKRSIVYVRQAGSEEPIFNIREIELGPMLGESYIVSSGLKEGEEIVTEGAFSVDAAAQLEGKPSMMNPGGEKVSSMPGMDMGEGGNPSGDRNMKQPNTQTERTPKRIQTIISVSGNCEMCKDRIETAAKSIAGVSVADWDVNTKKLKLEFSRETKLENIHKAIAAAGHDTEKIKASDTIYNQLPECCLYRK